MQNKKIITEGFEQFRTGTFGNGGQNIYVSRKGILQRIHHSDVTGNGCTDLIFCNSQNHEEKVAIHVYSDPIGKPEEVREIHIGGSREGCVTRLSDNGLEDLVLACGWDGLSQKTNSVILYGHEDGINSQFFNYLRTNAASSVAAGDFNGDGKQDLVFALAGNANTIPYFRVFYQQNNGFAMSGYQEFTHIDNINICAIKLNQDDPYDSLLIRKLDGAYTLIPGSPQGLNFAGEQLLLEADEDYVASDAEREVNLQTVDKINPRAQIIQLNGINYLCAFRQQRTVLYPLVNGRLGEPLIFECHGAVALAVGDIFGSGKTDFVFACTDDEQTSQCSWIYPQNSQGQWPEDDRIPVATYNASDVIMHDFSNNGCLDIIFCQRHTDTMYTSDILLFAVDKATQLAAMTPTRLPSHGANRLFIVNNELVVNNMRSGCLIGNPDIYIYTGDSNGYSPDRKISLPAWGAIDMVCCDFNDDGRADLALANFAELTPWLNPGSFVYYNSENGFDPERKTIIPTQMARGIACGDLNNNGFLDLVFNYTRNEIDIFHGSADGFSETNRTKLILDEGLRSNYITLADLNNNGYLDLVINFYSTQSYILWGGPDGFDLNNKQVLNVHNTGNIKIADLNNNGYPDLIFCGCMPQEARPRDSFIYIYHGSKQGYSEHRRTLLPSNHTHCMCIADFNNDGMLDIFAGSYQDGLNRDIDSFIYWNRKGKGFFEFDRTPLRTHAAAGCLALDINGNGYMDLVVGNHKVYGSHLAYSSIWYNGPDGFSKKNTMDILTHGVHGMGNIDLGNVMDRGPAEYYTSAPQKLPDKVKVFSLTWKGELMPGNEVDIMIRTANSCEALADSAWQENKNINPQGSWFQYRVALKARFAAGSPRIKQIIMNYKLN